MANALKNEPGFYNSGLILKNLLQNQYLVLVYLEGGTSITGTILGWDADYLLVRETKNLQMVPMQKVLRLQVDLAEILSTQALPTPAPTPSKLTSDPAKRYGHLLEQLPDEQPAGNASSAPPVPKSRLNAMIDNW